MRTLCSGTVTGGSAPVNNSLRLLFLYKYLQNVDFTPAVRGSFHNQTLRYTEPRHKGKADAGGLVGTGVPPGPGGEVSAVDARFEV